jgi:hypothetical protein
MRRDKAAPIFRCGFFVGGAIEQRLRENGYDSCALLTTIQTGGLSEKMPLCTAVGNRKEQ